MQNPFLFPIPEVELLGVLPILAVVVTGILALIIEMARPKHNNDLIVGVSLVGLVISAFLLFTGMEQPRVDSFGDTHLHDRFGVVMQLVILFGAFLTIAFSEGYLREKRIPFGEFYPLALWATSGAMIMSSTQNLLVVFVGLEILSVSLYVMAGIARSEAGSNESALKYFLLGAFASGFLLYGIAFLYGASGSLHLNDISVAVARRTVENQPLVLFGLAFILIGLGFKASLFPFHQWTPDVYQGAPTNVTAFMATVSKAGAFAALIRILDGMTAVAEYYLPALAVIALLTMTIGNVMALTQKDVKRILGYSSIAQAGYVLVAIVSYLKDPTVTTGPIHYYLFAYTAMTIGAFAVVSLAAKGGKEGTTLADLNGLFRRSPLAAFALVVFMASLIGLPMTAGFIGKLQIFQGAMQAKYTWLAIALAVNSIISVAYYLSIARAAITDDETADERLGGMNPGVVGACILGLAGVFGGFFIPAVIQFFIQR